MYSSKPAYVFGFHGLDEEVGIDVINNRRQLQDSTNAYDWLGHGVYFWENNYERAKQYAEQAKRRKDSSINKPFVIGAIIDLGECLDLLDQKWLDFLPIAYEDLKGSLSAQAYSDFQTINQDDFDDHFSDAQKLGEFHSIIRRYQLPKNEPFGLADFDFKKRELDCAVIRHAHELASRNGLKFDSVRAAFIEGDELYPGAGFKKHNHIQIAVINPNCIKGIFWPREKAQYDI